MSMMVTAEGAQKFFEPGKSYYLDFELAEE